MHQPAKRNNQSFNETAEPFAEVIQSSLHNFTAQNWRWNKAPAFGSLVTITTKERTLYGLVYEVTTGSIDPGRQPFAYQKTHEELLAEQPQLFEMLKTTFSCLIVGYQENGKPTMYHLLAPEPPLIHSFISLATEQQKKRFFASPDYLHLLFSFSYALVALDELLLALLKQQEALGVLNEESLTTFSQTFSLLTGNDYRRLKLFLQRAENFIKIKC